MSSDPPRLSGFRTDSDSDFAFAFNDANFSDRLLRIEIVPDDASPMRQPSSLGSPYTSDDGVAHENEDEEAVAMIEESPSGEEAADSNDSSWNMGCTAVHRVKTIHISSPILAAQSQFFYKLFSNGMRESEQRHITLRINASEEAAFMDLLNFMYSSSLTTTTPSALLDVLMAARKYEVASCMRYCSQLLRSKPMTCESALLYLDLPSTVLMADAVQPLTDAAKQFLVARFQEELLNLPLPGIEAVLSSDDLQVASEDVIYDLVLKWARTHYPMLEYRRDVVLEALFFKAEAPYRKRTLAAEDLNPSCHRFIERAYKYRPVKVVEFELPRQQCVVYLDLKREECAHIFPAGRVETREEYASRYKGNYTFTGGKAVGYRNLFGVPWTAFMAEDSLYFINGTLHLRAELTIRK
ncbi:hypothetical protein C3L33_16099, partial [Rhododendron williamsianum]